MEIFLKWRLIVCSVLVLCSVLAANCRAQRLPDAPGAAAGAQAAEAGVQYNTYFGDIHNHSNLSDGDGDPDDAYAHARDVAHMDFFSLSDHGENLLTWPWERKWETLKETAQAFNAPGQFVTLWGFEYSNPVLGHISVYNTQDYTSSVTQVVLAGFFGWLEDRPEGFAFFNHPGRYDSTGAEFGHLDLNEDVVNQMVGIETYNKGDGYERYYYADAYGSGRSYFDLGNSKGWRLGAMGGLDHHGTTWGSSSSFRTGVLATELTRAAIIDAYRNRRFYSTENKDLYVDFRCSGYPMGSQLSGVPLRFTVTARDGSGDLIQEVRLYRNGVNIDTRLVNSAEVTVSFSDPAPISNGYYYVMVSLNVGNHGGHPDEAITSPIWCSACEAAEGEGEGAEEGVVEGQTEGAEEGVIEGQVEGAEEGVIEGQIEGVEEGVIEGQVEGQIEGVEEGVIEGQVEGIEEGVIEGQVEGIEEGVIEGQVEGVEEGGIEGQLEGVEEGAVEGQIEGTEEGGIEGQAEGAEEGVIEGQVEGVEEGIIEGQAEGAEEGVVEGQTEGVAEGVIEGQAEGVLEGEGEGTPLEGDEEGTVEGEGTAEGAEEGQTEGEGQVVVVHSADQNGDGVIDLTELLRVIQFFNIRGFHCVTPPEISEDGFLPEAGGDQTCAPHASDYAPQDWQISLTELLRLIQFFNIRGYHPCPGSGTEDGFCPGI
jgi:hypothetical protein